MWQADKDVIPASEINHLSIENLRFALNLRKDENHEAKKTKPKKRPTTAGNHHLRSKGSASSDLSKPVECRNTVCRAREEDIVEELNAVSRHVNVITSILCLIMCTNYLQNHELKHRITAVKKDILDEEDYLQSCSKEYDQISEVQQRSTRKLAGLENDYTKVYAKSKKLREERTNLEEEARELYCSNQSFSLTFALFRFMH